MSPSKPYIGETCTFCFCKRNKFNVVDGFGGGTRSGLSVVDPSCNGKRILTKLSVIFRMTGQMEYIHIRAFHSMPFYAIPMCMHSKL